MNREINKIKNKNLKNESKNIEKLNRSLGQIKHPVYTRVTVYYF
jgi:hypothetical protein